MSALRRNFFSDVPMELRTVEHTLTYVEAALRKSVSFSWYFSNSNFVSCHRVPCHKIFIAHYEHVLADPRAYLEPLAQFTELSFDGKAVSLQSFFEGIHLISLFIATEATIEQARKIAESEGTQARSVCRMQSRKCYWNELLWQGEINSIFVVVWDILCFVLYFWNRCIR